MAYVFDADADNSHDWQCPVCRLAARARDGFIVLPNNPLVVTALQAICAGGPNAQERDGGWRRNRTGEPVYEFWNGGRGRIVARVEAHDIYAAWNDVRAYSALTLDVAVSVLAGLASDPFRRSSCAPRREPVALGASLVLNAKGYRRYGAERIAFAESIAREFERLERLRFEIIDYPAHDPQTRKWRSEGVNRTGVGLIGGASDSMSPANDAGDCPFARPMRFGAWAENWLSNTGVLWLTQIPQSVVRLDHRENRSVDVVAKAIALLVLLSFGAARDCAELRMTVRQLLRRIGLLPRLDCMRPAHSGRIADRLEEALLRLCEQGMLVSRLYADAAHARRESSRPWFEDWLDAEIVFSRPLVASQ